MRHRAKRRTQRSGMCHKNTVTHNQLARTTFRSVKNLEEIALLSDIDNAPLHGADIFDDIDYVCWEHEKLLSEVIDGHILSQSTNENRDLPWHPLKLVGQGGLSKKANKVQEYSTCNGIQGSTSKEEIKCVCLNAMCNINKKNELNIMVDDIQPHII